VVEGELRRVDSTSSDNSAIDALHNTQKEISRMNTRRLSFGVVVTVVASALSVACGGGETTPPAEAPPQPSASATETAPPPPASATASAEAPAPPAPAPETPAAPPAKPSKDKWVGKFAEDFSGDVKSAAEADAKKKAGAKDADNKKFNAAMDAAKAGVVANTIENTADTFVWSVKGKPAHTMGVKIVSGDDPKSLSLQFVKDGKKDLKTPIDVSITFTDDDTFEMKDPFAKKDAKTLVFKRQ
jgi:hypothetical protein